MIRRSDPARRSSPGSLRSISRRTGTLTFWFERNRGNVQGLIDSVGEDKVLFETDFPHPTCLYPSPLESVEEKMLTLRPETRRKVLGENAAKLYRL